MASNSEKVDQDEIPSRFNSGDLVWTRWHGTDSTISLAVICPDFGSNDQYTLIRGSIFSNFGSCKGRYYHVQRLGQSFEQEWLPEYQLNIMKHGDVRDMGMSMDDCKVLVEKTNEERVEICSIRAKANGNVSDVGNYEELLESKIQNEQLKCELQRLKDSKKREKTLEKDLKNLNESHYDLKKSVEDLKDAVMSQNQNKNQNEQEIGSSNDTANAENDEQNPFCFEQPLKKIKKEDQSEEIQRLNQIIKDLKEDNSKLSKENTKISDENAKLSKHNEEMQTQNEAMIKNLKEDRLKLAREIVELKYGHGSKDGSF